MMLPIPTPENYRNERPRMIVQRPVVVISQHVVNIDSPSWTPEYDVPHEKWIFLPVDVNHFGEFEWSDSHELSPEIEIFELFPVARVVVALD